MLHILFTRYKEVASYLVFGALTTMISILTYIFLTSFFLDVGDVAQLQVANIISWLTSVLFAYTVNKRFVFQSKNAVVKEICKFFLTRVGTLVLDMALMYLLVTMASKNDVWAKITVQTIVITLNYLLGKLLVFKEEIHK